MSLSEHGSELASAAGKASPPIAVASAAFAGYALQDWVMILTIVYTSIQIFLLVFRAIKGKTDGG